MPIIGNVKSLTLVYAMIIVVYYCFGTLLSVFPSATADFFGTKNLGVNYGWMFSAYAVAGIVGPMIGGYMFKTYHNYTVAFYTAGILALVAFACMLFATKPLPTTKERELPAGALPVGR
jgi:OFA family oxalate/formate antiporter-like MFS transporter